MDGATRLSDDAAMRLALQLADRARGHTSPNPPVGCVVLDRDGFVAGVGFTQPPGGAHAEVVALHAAGARAGGGTAVVTLEPCRHHGRTGPCTQALLAAGVGRVVYAVADPGAVEGGGAEELRSAGVEVLGGVLVDEARRQNEAWLTAAELGRPHVTWKVASSLDGRIATGDGSSQWITGPEARLDAHLTLRTTVDAVLVGSGTVLADDPQLTARDAAGRLLARQPLRVVLDRRGRVPSTARVLDDAAPSLVSADEPAELLRRLHGDGIRSVLLEGGPTLAGELVDAGLVDRVVAYLAPALIGGSGAPALGGAGVPTIAALRHLDLDDVRVVGPDLRVSARTRREA